MMNWRWFGSVKLAGIARSTVYANKTIVMDEYELYCCVYWMKNIPPSFFMAAGNDSLATRTRAWREPKRVQRLMQYWVGCHGAWPNTSKKHPAKHKGYPYLSEAWLLSEGEINLRPI